MPENQPNSKNALWQALAYAWQFGYTIAVPLVVLGIGGRMLDRRLDTAPWLFLTGLVVSIILSTTFLIIKASRILSSLDRLAGPTLPPKDETKNRSDSSR
ncbi:MAG: hypothetical protein UY81_C0051G0008 [Candidatus Giovannonibacteria bacterium GW2011_GWA2_53_7]|uniref:AtpZ/AtpI family protein n=1 Tax=Candidatus Giovannonibacteria bacterium GW2011_GWA2_53_7 TaxID=1618650 RepID=A0A0G2A2U4_9BACT|nr:MAG: hypothetical protein UY81_C0051G0008 [Candidatus Giovannonibacteria bacterium GW2011_GWA2_53_7]